MTLSLPSQPGTYALALTLSKAVCCAIGALGSWEFPVGDYIYVGSAWGSGGLAARVGRHLRGSAKHHWHIDYFRSYASPVAFWLAPGARLECQWAASLLACPGASVIVPRFGSSDCKCCTHLVHVAPHYTHTLALPGSPQYHSLS